MHAAISCLKKTLNWKPLSVAPAPSTWSELKACYPSITLTQDSEIVALEFPKRRVVIIIAFIRIVSEKAVNIIVFICSFVIVIIIFYN